MACLPGENSPTATAQRRLQSVTEFTSLPFSLAVARRRNGNIIIFITDANAATTNQAV